MPHRKILVVDDHADAAETTADLLRYMGDFEVDVAFDGLQAVEAVRADPPQVVVLDINMPVMDGYRAATLLRSEEVGEPRMLLIALSGRTEPEDVRRAHEAGFDHHLAKPLEIDDLLDLIDAYFEQRSASPDAGPRTDA